MKKRIKMLTAALGAVVLLCGFSVTAYAGGGPEWEGLDPAEETTTPEPTIEPGEGFTEEGNLVTRDLLYDEHTNKQFITVQTNGGNTFTSSLTTISPPTRTLNNTKPTFSAWWTRPICWPLWRRPGRNCPSVPVQKSAWQGRSIWIARCAPPI